jgi:hypothetical protein
MAKSKKSRLHAEIPRLEEPLKGVIKSTDELEYGLRGVVRILSGRGKAGKNGYFFEGFRAVFASEIGEDIQFEETFLDYENLRIVIKLPDPKDPKQKEAIRHQYLRQYTLGADDLKTRAALVAFAGLDDSTKQALIEQEREWTEGTRKPGGR